MARVFTDYRTRRKVLSPNDPTRKPRAPFTYCACFTLAHHTRGFICLSFTAATEMTTGTVRRICDKLDVCIDKNTRLKWLRLRGK